MTRRKLLLLLGATLVAPQRALAQSKQPVLIGFLNATTHQGHVLVAFKEGLAALGWKEGVNLLLEERWGDGRYERLQMLAEELASKKPAVIVASPAVGVAAAAKAAPRTPIVVAGGDPLAAGLVASLAQPGGMITGVSNIITQVSEKHVELLLDAVPKLRRIGFLGDSNSPARSQTFDAARRAAAQRSIEARFAEAASAAEIEPAIARLAQEGVQALFVQGGPLFQSERQRIAKLAAVRRWPFVGVPSEYAEAGALFAYGADRSALFRRAAYFVDRILRGAKPGDLPIEQPTKFELVVNLKTAKALGLSIPQAFLMRADRVIE